ncbi:MAG: hypothetical protein ACPL7O_05595 [Armatimonadota bacterium]
MSEASGGRGLIVGRLGVILAVECGFSGYKPFLGGCQYDHSKTLREIATAIDLVSGVAGGKAAFLVHTSPYVRRELDDVFYTGDEYVHLWRRAIQAGGEIGLHLHEDETDGSCYYYYYGRHMEKSIEEHTTLLSNLGIQPTCQIIGYYGMNEWITPIVERLGILVSLNNVGEYVPWSHSDWTKAPRKAYFHSYDDAYASGDSKVLEVPLGTTELMRYEDGLVINPNSLWHLKRVWRDVRSACVDEDALYFVLLRTWRLNNCYSVAERFIRFIQRDGALLLTPSAAWEWWNGLCRQRKE